MTTPQPNEIPPFPRRRSGVVTALGIINIVYSLFVYICCCGLFSLSSPFLTQAYQRMAEQRGLENYQPTAAMHAFSFVNGCVTIIFGALLLVAGIGLLQVRQWGRTLSLAMSWVIIFWAVAIFVINIFWAYPSAARMLGSEFPQGQMVISVVVGVLELFAHLVYPIILLISLGSRSVKAEFGIAQ